MWLVGILIATLIKNSEAGRCRALAIGGGTDLGAYEAGAIIGLIQGLPAGEAQWDIVTGEGVGAINGLMVSMYAKGQESAAATKLNNFWSSFTYSSFYQDWPGGYVTGLLLESGLYDTAPMKKTISSLQTGSFARVLGVGATDLISGKYLYFQSNQQSASAMGTGVYASASDYGMFPIVGYGLNQLLTGSILYAADILDAVTYCQKQGAANTDISIDVVLGAGKTLSTVDASHYKTLQVLQRYLSISSYNSAMQTVNNAKHDFAGLNVRSVIYPSQNIPSPDQPYDYTAAQLQSQISLGIADGKKAALTPAEE